jgi:hypothetical protein
MYPKDTSYEHMTPLVKPRAFLFGAVERPENWRYYVYVYI